MNKAREQLFQAVNNYCQVDGCLNLASHIHHIKHNTKVNRKKFPMFIDSPFNLMPICEAHHIGGEKKIPKQPNDKLCQLYEEYLEQL